MGCEVFGVFVDWVVKGIVGLVEVGRRKSDVEVVLKRVGEKV